LPIFSRKDGKGQELLKSISGHDTSETFVGHERLRQCQTDLQVIKSYPCLKIKKDAFYFLTDFNIE